MTRRLSATEKTVTSLLRKTDIVRVIGSYVSLEPSGGTFKGLCPFHLDKTRSFVVNPKSQIFHCFCCKASGDVIAFLVKREGLTFSQAVRLLDHRACAVDDLLVAMVTCIRKHFNDGRC